MKKLRVTLPYALMQAMLWASFAVLLNFSSNFLISKGFDGNGISLVLGLSTAISVAVQLVLAEQLARHPKVKLTIVLAVIGGIMLFGSVIMFCKGALAIIGFCVGCVLLNVLPAMVNALGVDAMERGAPINFGLARGSGSLSYSLLAFALGRLVTSHGIVMMPIASVAVLSLFLLSIVWFCATVSLSPAEEKVQNAKKKGGFLREHKSYAVFIAGCVFLLFSHNLISNFLLQIVQTKGGGAAEQGTTGAIAGVVELPAMFLFAYFLRLMGCRRWLQLSGFFFAARAAGMLFAPSIGWLYAAQLFQAVGFALYTISSVHYVEYRFPSEAVRAQSYLASAMSIGSVLASSTGGVLCEQFGAKTMMAVAVITALLGAIIVAAMSKDVKAKEQAVDIA